MHASWIRRLIGRSLLRERQHMRERPFGACPSCGTTLVAAEDWLDAERVVTEHLLTCERSDAGRLPRRQRLARPVLRPAL
jgi:hypothetical protein